VSQQLVTEIVGDASKFTKATKEAQGSAENLNGKLGSFGKGIVMGAGIAAFGALTSAIDTGISKLGEADQAFRENQVSVSNLDNAIRNSLGTRRDYTATVEAGVSAAQKLGFSDDEYRASLVRTLPLTKDMAASQKLTSEAMDLARQRHMDLATATGILIKAQEGNVGALRRMGIVIPPVTAAVDALRASHTKITPEALAAAKAHDKAATAALALKTVYGQVKGAASDFADTSEGKLAAANEKVHESMEKVGSIIDQVSSVAIPMLADAFSGIVDWFMTVWPQIQPAFSAVVDLWKTEFAFITKNIIPALSAALNWLAKNVVPAVIAVFNWLVKNVLPVVKQAFEFIAKDVMPAVAQAIEFITKNVLPPLATTFEWITKNVLPPFGQFLGWLNSTVFPAIGAAIGVLTKTVLPALGAAFSGIGRIVSTVFGSIVGTVKNVINTVIGIVNSVIDAIDAIQVHVHVGPVDMDWNGVGIGRIPRLHSGGVVPGIPGSDVLTILQAGEKVVARGEAMGGPTIIVNINGGIIDGPTIDRLTNTLAARLRFAPGT
jgi:phage-related protein